MRIKYDWMQLNQDGAVSFETFDTGFFKEWTLVQIEGEDPVAREDGDEKAE